MLMPHASAAYQPYLEYFSKREYPSGSSKVAPSASYERYAATTRLPNRELPSSISPGADYMSCRSYLDQVPTDRYSNRVTLQLGLSRAGNSNVQQLGITRAGNSNAYDYTEAAEQIHGREDYRRLSGIQVALSNCGFQIVNWSLSLVLVISGARVKLHEAHPGSSESIVEIQGIPDQVKAAQSLLQGFIGASSNSRQAPQSSRMAHYF
uniref:K Homology domain-containing protein n=1 Tax=Oryza nivara TaxID=4536 RepID=A0A0E0IUK4_ORYNI